jgi:hypothetical protein
MSVDKNLKLISLHDKHHSIQTQIGKPYPIPVALKVENQKISEVKFGYWRNEIKK